MKKVHAKCAIKERTRLALTAYQACHLELITGAKEGRRAPEVKPREFVLPARFQTVPLRVQ